FWWNYLRAQVFESYVTLFVLATFFHWDVARGHSDSLSPDLHFIAFALYLALLCLAKTVYLVLIPLFVIAMLVRWRISAGAERRISWLGFIPAFGIVLIGVFLVGCSHWYRFGSVF